MFIILYIIYIYMGRLVVCITYTTDDCANFRPRRNDNIILYILYDNGQLLLYDVVTRRKTFESCGVKEGDGG